MNAYRILKNSGYFFVMITVFIAALALFTPVMDRQAYAQGSISPKKTQTRVPEAKILKFRTVRITTDILVMTGSLDQTEAVKKDVSNKAIMITTDPMLMSGMVASAKFITTDPMMMKGR